ncbi:MAG: DUF983 domain-containing protein [Bacteroidota bacterium]
MNKEKHLKENLFFRIINERCPNCGQSHVFKKSSSIFQMPVMHEKCDECSYKFEREPGYFLGAMYVSYGIAVLLGILSFLILHFGFPSLSFNWNISILAAVMVLAAKKNYKLSRIIYIHIFPF